MAVQSFLEEYDFSGKTVIPFVTYGTGGLSSTVNDVTAALPDSATVLETVGVYRPEVDESRQKIQEWIRKLGCEAWRGEDESQHPVTVSDFYISAYEVSQDEYENIMGNNPSSFSGGRLPVENVSWLDAAAFYNA